jgi:hypothetical protein
LVVDEDAVVERDWSLSSERHFSRMVEIQVVAVECVVFVVGDAERRRWEWEERQRECDVEYAGTVLGLGIG